MSAATAGLSYLDVSFSSTSGASDLNAFIRDANKVALTHFRESFTNKTPKDLLSEEILHVFGNCRRNNWDGYGARPISGASFIEVQKFVGLIDSLPMPDVTAHPDGEMALDWYGSGGDVFSISFGEAGRVSYAGRFEEGNVIHGREKSGSLDVEFIEKLIRRVF
jgi:hypothetical protein